VDIDRHWRVNRGVRTQAPEARAPLFPERDVADLRKRWSDIQTTFVDEPRQAVERGDSLVADVMKRLAESFANERTNLQRQWARGDNVTTEDLRVALQRYRSFSIGCCRFRAVMRGESCCRLPAAGRLSRTLAR
jgi:hypothetical protein